MLRARLEKSSCSSPNKARPSDTDEHGAAAAHKQQHCLDGEDEAAREFEIRGNVHIHVLVLVQSVRSGTRRSWRSVIDCRIKLILIVNA